MAREEALTRELKTIELQLSALAERLETEAEPPAEVTERVSRLVAEHERLSTERATSHLHRVAADA